MTSALAYIAFVSAKNRILLSIRKLRNARYAISALAGIAYFYFVLGRGVSKNSVHFQKMFGTSELAVNITAGIVFVILVAVLAWPSCRGGVELSEAEIQFLFPSPLKRRDILLYKFLRAQLQLLISSAIATFFMSRSKNMIGMWFIFGSLSLYMMMMEQVRARLRAFRIGFTVRLIAVLSILGSISWMAKEAGTFDTPWIHALLYFPRFFALAVLPGVPLQSRLTAFAVLTLFGFVCFMIASSVDVNFREGSIELSQRKANAIARSQSQQSGQWVAFKRLPAPFRLAESGPPEIAIIWKNLIASLRIGMMPVIMLVASMTFIAGEGYFIPNGARFIAAMMLFLCLLVPLIGANAIGMDLRLDIQRIDALKTFPLPGERLVAAELAAPVIVISILELLFMAVTAIYIQGHRTEGLLARYVTPQTMVIAFIFIIPLCAMLITLRNAAMLLFPAWALRSKEEPRGTAVVGQRLVMAVVNLIVLAIAVIPAAVVLLPAFLIANRFFAGSPGFLAVATIPSVAVIVVELWIAVKLMGKYFEGFDATNELDKVLA